MTHERSCAESDREMCMGNRGQNFLATPCGTHGGMCGGRCMARFLRSHGDQQGTRIDVGGRKERAWPIDASACYVS